MKTHTKVFLISTLEHSFLVFAQDVYLQIRLILTAAPGF